MKTKIIVIAQYLLYLMGLFWLGLSGISLWRVAGNQTLSAIGLIVIAVMMIGNGIVLIFLGWRLAKHERWVYLFALFVVGLNILLTFTDEFGFYDFITGLIDVVILGLLIAAREDFRIKSSGE